MIRSRITSPSRSARRRQARPGNATSRNGNRPPPANRRQQLAELLSREAKLRRENEMLREALQKTQSACGRYRNLYDFAPVGYLVLTSDSTIREANATVGRLLGQTPASLVGRKFTRFVAPDSRQALCAHQSKAVGSQRPERCELLLLRGDGGAFPAQLETIHSRQGRNKDVACRCVITDISSRKRAEDALREHAARLRQADEERERLLAQWQAVFNHLTEGLIIADVSGRLLHWNPTALRLHGFRREKRWRRLLSEFTDLFELVTSDGKAMPLDEWPLSRILRGEVLSGYELTVRRLDRDWERQFSYGGALACGSDGKPLVAVLTITDVTASKRDEAALRNSEERLRLVMNGAPALISYVDSHYRYRSVNKLWSHWFRQSSARVEGRSVRSVLGQAAWRKLHPEMARALCGEIVAFEREVPYRGRGGRWLEINYAPDRGEDGRVRGFVAHAQDITQRKQAEKELLELNRTLERRVVERTKELHDSEKHIRTIVDSAAEGILALDESGRIESINPAALKLFGYTAQELVGQSMGRLLAAPDRMTGRNWPGSLFRNKHGDQLGHSREILGRRKDRSEIVLEVALTSYTQGGRRHSVIMVHDITERKRLEKEMIDVGERERQQVGHELHDDLGQILHGVQFLVTSLHARLEREGVTEPAQLARVSEYLDEALATTRSLARGLQPVPPVPEGLMNALQAHSARVSKLYKVRCHFSCPKPVTVTDTKVATHLFRIAQEAVSNAIRHAKCTRIHIDLSLANGNLILGIRDNGHARFPARGRRRGMGLHVMQFRAAAINGSLAVERRPGQGTEVVCRVSLTRQRKPAASPHSQRETIR